MIYWNRYCLRLVVRVIKCTKHKLLLSKCNKVCDLQLKISQITCYDLNTFISYKFTVDKHRIRLDMIGKYRISSGKHRVPSSIQSTLDISNSDNSNFAKLEASIWIKNTFWLFVFNHNLALGTFLQVQITRSAN